MQLRPVMFNLGQDNSVGLLHMFAELAVICKSLGAVALLANQLRRPMSASEVVLKVFLRFVLLATTLLQAMEWCVFEMDSPNVCGQAARGGKCSSALGIIAQQLLLPMSC